MLSLLVVSDPASAQSTSPLLYRELILPAGSYALYDLTWEIARQSGLSVSFNSKKLNTNKHIRIKKDRMTVDVLLHLLVQKANIHYKTIGSGIIFTPGRKRGLLAAIKQRKKNKTGGNEQEAAESRKLEIAAGTALLQMTSSGIVNDIAAAGDSSGHEDGAGGAAGGTMAYAGKWEDAENSLNQGRHSFRGRYAYVFNPLSKELPFLIRGGLGTNELFYINPTINAGYRFLYASVSYYTRGSLSHVRYGLGTAVRLNDQWQLHLTATTGRFSANTSVGYADTIPRVDTTLPPLIINGNQPVKLQSRLNQLSLSVAWRGWSNISVQAGVSFNFLHTAYFSNGNAIAPDQLRNGAAQSADVFNAIKLPYVLHDAYDPGKKINNQMWIGGALSVFYNLSGRR